MDENKEENLDGVTSHPQEDVVKEEGILNEDEIVEDLVSGSEQSQVTDENLSLVKQQISPSLYSFIKFTWTLQIMVFLILFGTLIFCGIEGNNAKVRQYDLYIQQENFNQTYLSNKSIQDPEQYYNLSLTVASLRCNLSNLDMFGWNSMNYSDAWMYSYSIVTTIGWGIHYPQSVEGKVFTIIYAIIGLPLIAATIGYIIDFTDAAYKSTRRAVRKLFAKYKIFAGIFTDLIILTLLVDGYLLKLIVTWASRGHKGKGTGLSLIDGIYYIVINLLTTVGFGDQHLFSIGSSRVFLIIVQMANLFLLLFLLACMQRYFLIVKNYFENSLNNKITDTYSNLTDENVEEEADTKPDIKDDEEMQIPGQGNTG